MSEGSTAANRAMIKRAFDDWSAGKGDVFSLLAENATWRIMGSDPEIAKAYHSREALLDAAAKPLAARLKGPLKPTVRRIWADGDEVIVFWDGEGDVYDGTKYRNTYLWIMTVKDRRIVDVTAFLDIPSFKAVLDRPPPPRKP